MSSSSSRLHVPENASACQNRDAWPPHNTDLADTYDWSQPTVAMYRQEGGDDKNTGNAMFSEAFATARRKLDYGYHQQLVLQRQLLQDSVLKRITSAASLKSTSASIGNETAEKQKRPWMIFTAGAMGAGKGYCLAHLSSILDLASYVQIDPDKLKQELPELAGYLQADSTTAGTKLHPESTHMADILLEHALQSSQPILIDGSLRDVEYYTTFLQRMRRDYGHYRLAILHVTADPDRVRQRAAQRGRQTGRIVPDHLLQASLDQVPRSVAALAPYTDAVHVVANNATLEWERSVLRDGATGQIVRTMERPRSWEYMAELFGVKRAVPTKIETPIHEGMASDTTMVVASTMAATFACPQSHATARHLWQTAYPNTCVRCALACDGQCGVCIHGKHLCSACSECGREEQQWEDNCRAVTEEGGI